TQVGIRVLDNDQDIDGDPITIAAVEQPEHGTALVRDDIMVYTPDANFNGSDSLTYTIRDTGGLTNTATVRLTVTPVNDAPVAADDTLDSEEDRTATAAVLGNDRDIDGDELTLVAVTTPAHGSAFIRGSTIVYAPAPDFAGTEVLTYTVADTDELTATAALRINVAARNDDPVIAQGESAELTTSEDAAAPASLLLGAADVDSPAAELTWTVAEKPSHGSVQLSGAGDQQLVQYAPAADYAGEDAFVVRVADGNGGAAEIAVDVNVTPVNDPPRFAQGMRVNVAMDEDGAPTPFRLSLGAEDIDSDVAELGWEIRSAPENGQAAIAGEGATRSIVYTPARDFTGEDTFVVRVVDDAGAGGDIAVNVTVAPVNDAPVIAQGTSTTVEMSEDSAP
ncbi:MAG: tandem-95 repeat protein, partial [Caldilineaceae bacterium]|nr:tandem-95 repeat protein [Caldilineaceae bacterium]